MLLRDGAVYIASRAVPGVMGFATAMLLTWILPAGALGLYGLGLAAATLGNSVLFEWIAVSFMRWHETHQQDPHFASTILSLFAVLALLPAIPLLALSLLPGGVEAAIGVSPTGLRLAWLTLFGAIAYGWFEFASRVQISRFSPTRFLVMTLARNGLMLVGVVSSAYLTGSAEWALAAGFVAMAAAGCLYLRDWASFRPRHFDPALARAFFGFGAPVGATRFLSGLITAGTPLLLGTLAGVEAVAAFTVSNTLVVNTLGVITTGLAAASFPPAVRAVESGDNAAAQRVIARNYVLLLSILLPAGAGFALLSPGIAQIFVGPEYRTAVAQIVPWLVLATVLLGLRSVYVDYAFHLAKTTAPLAVVVLIGALANLAICFTLVPSLGQIGAAFSQAVAAALMLGHAAVLSRRAYPMPTPLGETLRIVAATAAMALALILLPLPAGLAGLLLGISLGVLIYGAAYAGLDALGPRRLARIALPMLRTRTATTKERPAA